jgi:hypothetical protein
MMARALLHSGYQVLTQRVTHPWVGAPVLGKLAAHFPSFIGLWINFRARFLFAFATGCQQFPEKEVTL